MLTRIEPTMRLILINLTKRPQHLYPLWNWNRLFSFNYHPFSTVSLILIYPTNLAILNAKVHCYLFVSRTLEWTYVVGIYEDTSYGILGFAEVTRRAELTGLCIAKEFKVKRYYKTEEEKYIELYDIIDQLDDFNNTEGTVILIISLFKN